MSRAVRPTVRVTENARLAIGNTALSGRESLSVRQKVSRNSTLGRARVSAKKLQTIKNALTNRDLAIIAAVKDCRLITTLQLQRLHFTDYKSPQGAARASRRALQRLSDQGIVSRRDRRIGGARRGSTSYVYSLGLVGARLLSEKRLRTYTTDPSDYFFDHTLELTELYTQFHEQAHVGSLQLLEIQTEPDCWRPLARGTLRPDMFVRTAHGDEEYSWFIEVDRATTHLPALLKKMRQYEQYYAAGVEQAAHGVFPQVLWIVSDGKRMAALNKAVSATQSGPGGLFVVKTTEHALAYICKPDTLG